MSAVCVIARSDRFWPRNPRHGAAAYPSDAGRWHRPDQNPAKLANHAAKQWPRQTGGVVDLSCPQRQRKLMALLPVSEVWGIGRRIGKSLKRWGSARYSSWRRAISALSASTSRWCSNERYGSCAASLAGAGGVCPAKQEIICSRSFGDRITAYEDMRRRSAAMPRGQQKSCAVSISTAGSSPPLSKPALRAE